MTIQKDKPSFLSLNIEEAHKAIVDAGFEKYRAEQILDWVYKKNVLDFEKMTNLSPKFRKQLKNHFDMDAGEVEVKTKSKEDGSIKMVIKWPDGQRVETVLIPRGKRRTVCVSSQVGCKFGCVFCASGQAGFARQLSVNEVVAQVLHAKKVSDTGNITHVVFMGMGEPFDNYEVLMKSIERLNDAKAFNIGARRITVSTSGLVNKIQNFIKKPLQAELSISLHGATDKIRQELMPINRKWPVQTLISACRSYTFKTGRIITFEYLLAKGLNASEQDAKDLLKLLTGLSCKVNLIPLNPIPEFPYQRPTMKGIRTFQRALMRGGINATVRFSRGNDIDAACGQLRRRVSEKE